MKPGRRQKIIAQISKSITRIPDHPPEPGGLLLGSSSNLPNAAIHSPVWPGTTDIIRQRDRGYCAPHGQPWRKSSQPRSAFPRRTSGRSDTIRIPVFQNRTCQGSGDAWDGPTFRTANPGRDERPAGSSAWSPLAADSQTAHTIHCKFRQRWCRTRSGI